MSSLFKPTIVSYHLPDGKRVSKGTPEARKRTRKAKNWYGQYRDANGQIVREALCPDKATARQMLSKLESDAAFGRRYGNPPTAKYRSHTLKQHVEQYRLVLEGKGDTAEHVARTIAQINAVIDDCNLKSLAEIDADKMLGFLESLRKNDASANTRNHYLRAIKSFTSWLVDEDRAVRDPLRNLKALNIKMDKRIERRALSDDELLFLLDAARNGPVVHFLDGHSRWVLYSVAVTTGFRAGELASLTPRSFDLDADHPCVRLEASNSKRRKDDELPLSLDLLPVLRKFLADRPQGLPVWTGSWHERAAEMLRVDLAAGRAAWIAAAPAPDHERREQSDFLLPETSDGRTFDFHSLRSQFITSLARAGVHPKKAKELARHSDVNLTMGYYTHLTLQDQAEAVNRVKIPGLSPQQRTGTEG